MHYSQSYQLTLSSRHCFFSHCLWLLSCLLCTLSLSITAFHPAFLLDIRWVNATTEQMWRNSGFTDFHFAYRNNYIHCTSWCPVTDFSWRTYTGKPSYKIYCAFRFLPSTQFSSRIFLLAPSALAAAKSSNPQQTALNISIAKWQLYLHIKVPLIQEFKKQTNERQFTSLEDSTLRFTFQSALKA